MSTKYSTKSALLLISLLSFITSPSCYSQLIEPAEFEYLGAFRLPITQEDTAWDFGCYAMTYYPLGDPFGPDDNFPGSLFTVGHPGQQLISEISIPEPAISPTKNPEELPRATTLQPFADITGGVFGALEMPHVGLEYLPPQQSQTSGKLHFCWGQHLHDGFDATHGWSELDLSNPQTAGPWYFSNLTNYVTNDYLFEIPERWALIHTPGKRLAAGRLRDGGWSGFGPTLFAYAPWNDGNPPAPYDTLRSVTPLLLYGVHVPGIPEIETDESRKMKGYKLADYWSGGAWLTAGNNEALIFVGTKAMGNCWYGYSDGTVYPDAPPYPDLPPFPHQDRGFWADSIRAWILFFDPADIAAVVAGTLKTWDPQPYDSLDITDVLFDPGYNYVDDKMWSLGAAAFDRTNGILYIAEHRGVEYQSIIHVWQLPGCTGVEKSSIPPRTLELHRNFPNPFNPTTTIQYTLNASAQVKVTIYDITGKKVIQLCNDFQASGQQKIVWNGRDALNRQITSGMYLYCIRAGNTQSTGKMLLLK